jgi:hypothetical protein
MKNQNPTVRELYPGLNEEERDEAESVLERYIEIVLGIHERTEAETSENESLNHFPESSVLDKPPTDLEVR